MTPLELAREFIKKGQEDELACRHLADASDVGDAPFGLHAQQAIEKYLKAILAINQERPEHTHDLESLAAQCEDGGHRLPSELTGVFALTPFASELRYPFAKTPPIDRTRILELVVGVRQWVEHILS